MHRLLRFALTSLLGVFATCALAPSLSRAQAQQRPFDDAATVEACFDAPSYVVYSASGAVEADGRIDESAWSAAPWTSEFVDMRGGTSAPPPFATRVKMLWDEDALYVAADLEEEHVWATLEERDTLIYLDHAFEVFIDPDGDTQNYYELEVNALGTIWDLMLLKPYRDGGPALSSWDIRGIEVGVGVDGTLNDPADVDDGWTVEFALPWSVLAEAAPEGRLPMDGERWQFNFSRSHWSLETTGDDYRKIPETPARWSSWSPQGEANIHKPECWGSAQFTTSAPGSRDVAFDPDPDRPIRLALRRLYYRQLDHHARHGRFADDLAALRPGEIRVDGRAFEPVLIATQSSYEITAPGSGGSTLHIRADGRAWRTQP